jgi:hypothetical protein
MSKPRQPRRPPRRRRSRTAHPAPPRNRLAEIQAEIQEVQQQIEHSRQACRLIRNAAELTVLEQEITRLTDRLAKLLIAETLQRAADDHQTNEQARSLFQGAGVKLKNQGKREVTIRTTRGSLTIRVTYYSRNCDRSRENKGLYPILLVWGVHGGCTLGLASEVSKLVAVLGSLDEVEQLLEERGHDLSINTIRGIAYHFAARARAVQRAGRLDWGESVVGRRVVISTDGGRLRIRTTKRGPKTAKGRNRYRTDWREPKLLMIYILDEQGKMDREFLAVIDGTLRGPEAIFALMACYLRELKIEVADQILFVADGARWIWNRVESLVRGLGIKPGQIHSLVDFYHAVEHLGAIAGQKSRWTAQERKTWVKRQRRRLLKGQTQEVLDEIEELCGPRGGSVLKRERGYFRRNIAAGRMDYHRLAEEKWPIGSGAMESAIRRVINLRLKGAGIFWHEKSAEAVLLLRAYYKAGRWKNLENQVVTAILEDAA